MSNPKTAYLVCIYDHTGKLVKRRIALSWTNVINFIDNYADMHNAIVYEGNNDCSGSIVGNITHTYDIANIAVV